MHASKNTLQDFNCLPTNIAVVHTLLLIIITTKIVVDNKLVISTSLMSKWSFPLSI